MKIVVFSDLHAHNYARFSKILPSGLNSRLVDTLSALMIIKQYCSVNSISTTLCAGDIINTFSYVENDVFNCARNVVRDWPGRFVYVAGNHDINSKGDYAEHQVATLGLRDVGATYLHRDKISIDGISVFGMGWRDPKRFYDEGTASADIFMGHQMIENGVIKDGMPLQPGFLKKYKLAIFGDIHVPMFMKKPECNVLVPGAPLQHNFGDEGQTRGFWVVDTDSWEAVMIPITSLPQFYTVESVDSIGKDFSKEQVAHNFFRVRSPSALSAANATGNISVQKQVKQSYRESGICMGMSDADMLRTYVGLKAYEGGGSIDDLLAAGADYIKGCESTAALPVSVLLTDVKVRNFGSFVGEHAFNIQPDIYLVLGDNGFGKTTFFEAIYWGLFGETTKGVSADAVINDTVKKDACVELVFAGGDCTIIVQRYRKDEQFGNKLLVRRTEGSGASVDIVRESIDETQKELLSMLGTSASFFKNINYFSQEDFEFFSTMTDAGQKAVCKNLLLLDRFEAAENKASFDVKKYQSDYEDKQRTVSIKEAAVIERRRAIESLQGQVAIWEASHVEAVRAAEAAVAQWQGQLDALYVRQQELHEQENAIVAAWEKNKPAEIQPFDSSRYDKKKAILSDEVSCFRDELTQADHAVLLASHAENAARNAVSVAKDRIVHFTSSLDKAINERDYLVANGSTCPACGAPLNKDKLNKLLADKEATVAACMQDKIQQEHVLAISEQTLSARTEELTLAQSKRTVAAEASRSAEESLSAYNLVIAEALSVWKLSVQDAESRAREITASHYEQLRSVQDAKRTAQASIDSCLSNKLLADRAMVAVQQQTNPILAEITVASEALRQIEYEVASILDQLKGIEILSNRAVYWKKGLSNQGIVSYLLDGFAKEFTETINSILLDITDGKYAAALSTQKQLSSGEFRDKFELKIYIGGKERSYKALSGGQKARVNLATVMALVQVIMRAYSLRLVPFGIVILDELFTYLDNKGVEAVYDKVVKFFSGIAAVYAVTHKDELKALFNNCMVAEYDEVQGTRISCVRQS